VALPTLAQDTKTNSGADDSTGATIHSIRNIPPNPAVPLPPASTKPNINYDTDIKPILDANCIRCHVGDKVKLHLDTRAGILQGTKDGKVVIPGAPEKSWLVKLVLYSGSETNSAWMPPQHNKAALKPLTPEQIGLLIGWIKQGAN
jgi:hypothetical protein